LTAQGELFAREEAVVANSLKDLSGEPVSESVECTRGGDGHGLALVMVDLLDLLPLS
jgi:hypothetical protein